MKKARAMKSMTAKVAMKGMPRKGSMKAVMKRNRDLERKCEQLAQELAQLKARAADLEEQMDTLYWCQGASRRRSARVRAAAAVSYASTSTSSSSSSD